MDFPKHTLTFVDGYSFTAELNGTTYFPIDVEVPDSELTDANLTEVKDVYTDDLGVEVTETKTNLTAQSLHWPNIPNDENSGKQYLAFSEIPEEDLKYQALQSKLEYLAIMTDNDISSEE